MELNRFLTAFLIAASPLQMAFANLTAPATAQDDQALWYSEPEPEQDDQLAEDEALFSEKNDWSNTFFSTHKTANFWTSDSLRSRSISDAWSDSNTVSGKPVSAANSWTSNSWASNKRTRSALAIREESLMDLLTQVKFNASYKQDETRQKDQLSSWSFKLDSERRLAEDLALMTAYQFRKINPESRESRVGEGFNVQLELGLHGRLENALWKVRYRVDDDSREDSRTATTFTSYSAVRNTLGAHWQQPLLSDLLGEFSAEYRNSTYKDPNFSKSISERRRIDHQTRLKSVLSWNLMQNVSLNSEFTYVVNNSSIESYDYRNHVISGKLYWKF